MITWITIDFLDSKAAYAGAYFSSNTQYLQKIKTISPF